MTGRVRAVESRPDGHWVTVTDYAKHKLVDFEELATDGGLDIDVYVNATTLEELAAAHTDIGNYLAEHGQALTTEPPAFDPEYVAEALRSTLRATSFEGGVSEDLVEEFIAAYEKAVEDGSRA